MTTLTLSDQQRWLLQVYGKRIPCSAWSSVEDSQAILAQANQAWQQTQQDIEQLRQEAVQQGWQQGHEQAMQQWQQTLLDAQLQARSWLADADTRVVALAQAVLARVLPRLAEQDVVADMLRLGLRETAAQRYLRLRVHPDLLPHAERALAEWQATHGQQPVPELIPDQTLPRMGCVVESELGQLLAGPDFQLHELFSSLYDCARFRSASEVVHE